MRRARGWSGSLLVGALAVGTLWLAVTGQLDLYLHPRYEVFAVVMSAIALVACVARIALPGDGHEHVHGHDGEHEPDHEPDAAAPRRSGWSRAAGGAALALSVAFAAGTILLPPATLSSAAAAQRDVTATRGGVSLADATGAAGDASAAYTVRDWSSLLAQTDDPGFFRGKPATVTGFVLPDPDGADDIVYVARFVITHCTIDAQPVGVPVYLPDWADEYAPDDWIEVRGGFAANPSAQSTATLALDPAEVSRVDPPSDPYLY